MGNQRGGGIGENHNQREGGLDVNFNTYGGDQFLHSFSQTRKVVEELLELKYLYLLMSEIKQGKSDQIQVF